jgi:two-component system, cell cycle sensor histidine kinase and response regulator CckA
MSSQDSQSSDLLLAAALDTVTRLEQRLRGAQKMEAVGMLAGGIAHDFNNLLTVINGYSDMLLTGYELPQEARTLIAMIRETGERAAALVRGLLLFSGRKAQEPSNVNLNESVSELCRLVSRLLPANIELTTALEPHLKTVVADPGCIQQALLNLVINARDAMPHGGKLEVQTASVTLDSASAELHPSLPAGDYILLTVSDTGIGMDDEIKQHLFEPFYTTKAPSAGTGLGLSMVHDIVKQSCGFLSVRSEKGNGTTLSIYLPCSAEGQTQEASVLEEAPTGNHETILIVDHSPEVRRFLHTMLKDLGYSALEAASASEVAALSSGIADSIDLLVADVALADASGIELARRLRESRPRLPVLYISGDTSAIEGVQASGAEFLAKPFTMAGFAARVRRILDSRKRDRILFVDDDADVALFASRILSDEGYEVLVGGDGDVALSIVQTERPDLVITDLVMPGREGLATIMALRKSHPSLPVIAISGAFGGYFLKAATTLGARASLPKPFTREQLLEAVRAVLGDRGRTCREPGPREGPR